jgi:hypothetical protein
LGFRLAAVVTVRSIFPPDKVDNVLNQNEMAVLATGQITA